jgi:hypothetical protein
MILPTTGIALPPWRRQVMIWLMAAVRLLVCWLLLREPLAALLHEPGFIVSAFGRPSAWSVAALFVAGALLFAWPRTVLVGCVVLVAGLFGHEWLWYRLGGGSGRLLLSGVAIFTVLAAGEWLVQRLQKRLYASRER